MTKTQRADTLQLFAELALTANKLVVLIDQHDDPLAYDVAQSIRNAILQRYQLFLEIAELDAYLQVKDEVWDEIGK